MAKRGPERGSSPDKNESTFQKDTATRLASLEAEINSADIPQDKKDHLILALRKISEKLDSYDGADNKKEFKNKIHLEIASLGLEFQGAKNSKRKSAEAKPFSFKEYKGKKDREIEQAKLFADLEEARLHLVGQSSASDNVLFKNFGKYKKIKGEITELLEIKDPAGYEAKKLEIETETLALLDIKKGENKAETDSKEIAVPEQLQPEPEEDEKEKPEHKTKKASKRKAGAVENGQEQRVERHQDAVKRWDILQEIIGKMLREGSVSEETTDAINGGLKTALESNDAEEYENAMSAFERNFDLIIRTIPTKARLEYFSQLNGNPPFWEKEEVKTKEKEAEPVVEKDWQEDRDKTLQYADERWELLRSLAMEKMTKEERAETKENEEKIESALEKIEATDDWDEYREQLRVFEHNFTKVFLNVSEAVRKEFNLQKASLGKGEKKKVVPVVEKDEKESSVVVGDAVVDKDAPEYRQKRYQEMNDKFALFKNIAEEILTDDQADNIRSLVEEIEESLDLTYHARNPRVHSREIDRAESAFTELLTKVPSEVKLEYESQLADKTPSLRREEMVKKDTTSIKEIKDKVEDKDSGVDLILEEIRRIKMVERIMRQRFHSKDKSYNFYETRTSLLVDAAIQLLNKAKASLVEKDSVAHELHLKEAKVLINELWNSLPNNVKKEHQLRLNGKETSGTKQEREEYENRIKKTEDDLSLFEMVMDEQDKNLRVKFTADLQAVKDAIAEAKNNLDNEDVYEEKLDKLMRAFGKLTLPEELKEVKNKFYGRLAEINKKSQPTSVDLPFPETDKNTLETPTTARISGEENLPSPEQKMLLQMYERDFGTLEKIIQNSGNPEVMESFKWRMEVIRTNIDKAKKEMSQHNKLDETVLYNMQAFAEDLQKHYPKLHAEFIQKISPQVPAAPAPEKKGVWGWVKEKASGLKKAVISKEFGLAIGKASYDTVTTLFGVKIITDIVYGGLTGRGDFAEWRKGSKESKTAVESIFAAHQDLLVASEKNKKGEALSENERIEKRIEYLKEKIGSANIKEEAKKQILERLWAISIKHKTETTKSRNDRDSEVRELLESYIHGKVSGVKIAKDALNLGLTVTGISLLRGAVYLAASAFEKIKQVKKEEIKDIAGSLKDKKDAKTFTKDIISSTAKETARALTFRGAKEGSSGVARAMDFVKALGTIARGVGIFNITVLHGGSPKESIDNLIQAIKEKDASIISDSFVQNAKRVWETPGNIGHLAESAWDKVTGHESIAPEIALPSSVAELPKEDIVAPVNTVSVEPVPEAIAPETALFSVQDFAAEHKLSEESLVPLQKLVEQYPSLKEESLSRILEASKVGDGVKFHHADLVRGDVDTLIEAEGERRSVIFEELVKAKDYEGAAKYLESQDFSSRHKSYLAEYIGKGTHEDYLKFVEQYDEKPDKKMVYGLFRAMQGKGNTDLANAGFFRAATEDRTGRTVSLQGGELKYFGLDEKGEPILSGQGRVVLKETVMVKITTSPTTIEEAPYEGDFKNAPAVELPEGDRAVLAEIEADKAKFAKMGEEAINISDRARAGEPVGTYVINAAKEKAGNLNGTSINDGMSVDDKLWANANIINDIQGPEVVGEETTTEKTLVGKTIKTFKASGEVVQAAPGAKQVEIKTSLENTAKSTSEIKPVSPTVEESAKQQAEKSEAIAGEPAELTEKSVESFKVMYQNFESMKANIALQKTEFIMVGDGQDILKKQIENEPSMASFKEYAKKVFAGDVSNLDEKVVESVRTMKDTLDAFNHIDKNPDWYKNLEGEELKLFLDPNKDGVKMLANDSHIARITDREGKEFLISDLDNTFVVKDGVLLKMDDGKIVQKYSYEEAVNLANDMLKNEPGAPIE